MKTLLNAGCLLCVLVVGIEPVIAASPASIEQGRQLFERSWTPGNPTIGSDRLGPVFNADSCVACHHLGGVGGAGDSRFNAQAIGIESMRFSSGRTTTEDLRAVLLQFYPGFVQPDGSIVNTASFHHHSVSDNYSRLRRKILDSVSAATSVEGGPVSVEASRRTSDTPIVFTHEVNGKEISVTARLFQRNTTSLFGVGLIDAVEDSAIRYQARMQQRHPEVSGRPSVLPGGSIGRFGWRGNVSRLAHFVDRACANELGLETKRRRQPADPTRPDYRNPAIDITDEQIDLMTDFLASLPAPIQQRPADRVGLDRVNRGRAAFTSVGCAVCHVPVMGPASGIYSDLLLHDMGSYSYDYDAAEPHVVRQQFARGVRMIPGSSVTSYYGVPTAVPAVDGHFFKSPKASTVTTDYVPYATIRELGEQTILRGTNNAFELRAEFRDGIGWDRRLQPSNTAQEWRTPPLWGLRDSAPYLHDGRAETVLEAISMHDGEAAGSRDRFLQLPLADRQAILAFLDTLVAPPNVPQAAL